MKINALHDGGRNLVPETTGDCEAIMGIIGAYAFVSRDPHLALMLSYSSPEDANPSLPDDSELERIAGQTVGAHRALTSDNPLLREVQLPVAFDTERRRNMGDLTAAMRICGALIELVDSAGSAGNFSGPLAEHIERARQFGPILRAALLPEQAPGVS